MRSLASAADPEHAAMDAGSLNAAEELVLGCGLVATVWLLLAIARKLLGYALSGALVVAGLALAASMFLYRPSRVYAWLERNATDEWQRAPTSEQLIDRSLAGLHWLEDRLVDAKGAVDHELTPPPRVAKPAPPPAEDDGGDHAASSLAPSR
jgi:hypothetical protein